jgi:hypothetical protein
VFFSAWILPHSISWLSSCANATPNRPLPTYDQSRGAWYVSVPCPVWS